MKAQAIELTVRLSIPELTALSYVAVVVTSAADVAVINAAESGLQAVRAAAHTALLKEQL